MFGVSFVNVFGLELGLGPNELPFSLHPSAQHPLPHDFIAVGRGYIEGDLRGADVVVNEASRLREVSISPDSVVSSDGDLERSGSISISPDSE